MLSIDGGEPRNLTDAEIVEAVIYGDIVKTDHDQRATLADLPDPIVGMALPMGLSSLAKLIAMFRVFVLEVGGTLNPPIRSDQPNTVMRSDSRTSQRGEAERPV